MAKILSGQLQEQQSISVPSSVQPVRHQVQPKKVARDTLHPPVSPKQFRAVNRIVINSTVSNSSVNGVETA